MTNSAPNSTLLFIKLIVHIAKNKTLNNHTPHNPTIISSQVIHLNLFLNYLGIIQKGLYDAENILKCGFVVSVLLHMSTTNILGYSVCLLAIYRQLKRPRWDKSYAHKLFINEFTHNIFYLSRLLFFENFQLLFYYFPLIIHFWIGISEYLNLQGGWLYNKTRKYVDAARAMKSDMMKWKYLMEILLFPVSVIMIFIGMSNIYFVMFYSSFLRIKYVLNDVIID